MCLLIREVLPADLDQLTGLCEAHAAYEGVQIHFNEDKKRQLARMLFEEKSIKCMVVEEAKRLVGYTTFGIQYATWSANAYLYMDCLYLCNSARGKGTGKLLMGQIADFMQTKGILQAQWQTPIDNAKAIAFYRQMGANDLSKSRFFWEPAKSSGQ